MDVLDLSGHERTALRALMAAEPVPGRPLPSGDVMHLLDALVPCDELGIAYVDMTGLVTGEVHLAPTAHARGVAVTDLDMHIQHSGPFYLGVMHWRLHPYLAEGCGVRGGPRDDGLAIGFRNGTNHVVQYWFDRQGTLFSARELAILDLLGPVLQRLARERPTPTLPPTLTITERRMLCEVAAGLSNAEIAEGNCIAVGTVRKHLENSYRKLGVSSRHAAIARLRGSDQPGLDLKERVERYA